jgi:hypothetical protein
MFLAKAIPHQHWQEVSHTGKRSVEVRHTAHDVGFAKSPIPDSEGERVCHCLVRQQTWRSVALVRGDLLGREVRNLTGKVT